MIIHLHHWQLPLARPFGWRMKPLSSAQTNMRILANGRRELTISHDVIKGVTPEMLHWWFCHIDGEMVYAGQRYPRYQVWHPTDHIYYKDLTRDAQGNGGTGTRRQIVEAFQGNPRYLINIVDRVAHLGDDGILLSTEQAGVQISGIGNLLLPLPAGISTLEHQFIPVANGARYESRLLIGSPAWLGRWLLNPLVRRFVMDDEMARVWLQHNIEEVGNFEFFLPHLWAQINGVEQTL